MKKLSIITNIDHNTSGHIFNVFCKSRGFYEKEEVGHHFLARLGKTRLRPGGN